MSEVVTTAAAEDVIDVSVDWAAIDEFSEALDDFFAELMTGDTATPYVMRSPVDGAADAAA